LVYLLQIKAIEIVQCQVVHRGVDKLLTECLIGDHVAEWSRAKVVDDVGAQVGVDVFGEEFPLGLSVLCPVGVVADDSLALHSFLK